MILVLLTACLSGCASLTSFEGRLGLIINADNMFSGCTSLTSFKETGDSTHVGSMITLRTAKDMFKGCKLDKESILNFKNSLKGLDRPAQSSITIGIDKSLQNDSTVLNCINAIRSAGFNPTIEWN